MKTGTTLRRAEKRITGILKKNIALAFIFIMMSYTVWLALAGFSILWQEQENTAIKLRKELPDLKPDTLLRTVCSSTQCDGNNVYLAWVIRNQQCNGVYVVERHVPGTGLFHYIGFIKAQASGTKDVLLSYVDGNASESEQVYRIWFFGDNATFTKGESFFVNRNTFLKN